VSPLAFAGTDKDWGHKSHQGGGDSYSQDSKGFINVSENNINAPLNAANCLDTDLGALLGNIPVDHNVATLTGALSLLGDAKAKSKTFVDNSCDNSQGGNQVVGNGR
jgi:hypothetical protein